MKAIVVLYNRLKRCIKEMDMHYERMKHNLIDCVIRLSFFLIRKLHFKMQREIITYRGLAFVKVAI